MPRGRCVEPTRIEIDRVNLNKMLNNGNRFSGGTLFNLLIPRSLLRGGSLDATSGCVPRSFRSVDKSSCSIGLGRGILLL